MHLTLGVELMHRGHEYYLTTGAHSLRLSDLDPVRHLVILGEGGGGVICGCCVSVFLVPVGWFLSHEQSPR